MPMPRRPYLTSRASAAFALAHDLADRLGHDTIAADHLALGVLHHGKNLAVAALHNRRVPLATLVRDLEATLPPPGSPKPLKADRDWTPADEALIKQAEAEAAQLDTPFYACEHLLLVALRDASGGPARALALHGLGVDEMQAEVRRIYASLAAGGPAIDPPAV